MKVFSPYKFFLCAFLGVSFLFCFNNDNMMLTAEKIVYEKEKNILTAEQNVEVKYKDIHLRTESLIYDVEKNVIYIDTTTTLFYKGDEIFLKKLLYEIDNQLIKIHDFYIHYHPYYSYSKECIIQKEKFFLTDSKVTHCSLRRPHYYLASKKVIIYPHDKIIIYNPKLIIRNFPVFWLPYYKISLKPTKDYLVVEPGYESERGLTTRLKYGRKLTEDLELRVNCENYSKSSIGLSSELRYDSDFYNGIIYSCYISEFETKTNRWNIRINTTNRLPYRFSFRTNLEFISDESLYYYYNKESWFLLKRELNSSASLSWDTQKISARSSYLRKDIYSDEHQKFINSEVKMPSEITVYPFNISKLKISNSLKIVPSLIENSTFYKFNTENNFSLSIPLAVYFLSFTPSLNIVSNYIYHVNDLFYNIYGVIFPLRINIIKRGGLDLVYSYKIKTKENSFEVLASTSAFNNSLQVRLDFYYKRNFFRCYTTYDFLKQNNVWYYNFTPVVTNIGFGYKFLDFQIYKEYLLQKRVISNFQFSLTAAIPKYNRISLGYGQNYYQPETHYFSTQLDLYFPDNFQFKLKASTNFTKNKFEFPSVRFDFYKDLHCWEAMIFCDLRKSLLTYGPDYIYEVGGNIGLKFKPYVGTGGKVSDIDKRYYPWRE
ncbi:MAG: hypothetical protein ABDH23_00365 [Endomicrobiia bacterium]